MCYATEKLGVAWRTLFAMLWNKCHVVISLIIVGEHSVQCMPCSPPIMSEMLVCDTSLNDTSSTMAMTIFNSVRIILRFILY